MRRSLFTGVLALVLLVGIVAYCSLRYEAQMLAVTHWVHDTLGLSGLIGILVLSDSVITPIPPDALLVVIAKSELHERWPWVILLVGCCSAAAGCAGFYFGKHAGSTAFATRLLSRRGRRAKALVARHGKWAVALGAITPIPFSITCWFAGIFGVPFGAFGPMTLLRIPRFYVYYVAIAYGDVALRTLWT